MSLIKKKMKAGICGAIMLFNFSNLFAQSPNWAWAKNPAVSNDVSGVSIAADANGNTYATGSFNDSVTFGSTTLTNTGFGTDLFIVKYDAAGNVLWAKSAGGADDDDAGTGIAVDANSNAYLTGFAQSSTITFGSMVFTNDDPGGNDFFVVKYDSSGTVIWATYTGSNDNENTEGIAVDALGNSYVTGTYGSDTLSFGNDTLFNTGPVFSSRFFVAKYDTAGNVIWAAGAAGNDLDYGRSVTADAAGNVFVTGGFNSDTMTFGSIALINAGAGFATDVFIVKYDSSGAVVWAKSAGGAAADYALGITADNSNHVYLTGWFRSSSINFGSTTLVNSINGSIDLFVVKLDSSGNEIWARRDGGSDDDIGFSIATDAYGRLYVTGYFWSPSITFNTTVLMNSGIPSMFIASYDSSGNVLWAKSATGSNATYAYDNTIDGNGNVYMIGIFKGPTLNFGSITVLNNDVTGLSYDLYIAKLDSAISTGMEEPFNPYNSLVVFPNPSFGEINIKSSLVIDKIEITNVIGQIIYRATPKDNKSCKVQLKQDGIYFVTVNTNDRVLTKKIIVRH